MHPYGRVPREPGGREGGQGRGGRGLLREPVWEGEGWRTESEEGVGSEGEWRGWSKEEGKRVGVGRNVRVGGKDGKESKGREKEGEGEWRLGDWEGEKMEDG